MDQLVIVACMHSTPAACEGMACAYDGGSFTLAKRVTDWLPKCLQNESLASVFQT